MASFANCENSNCAHTNFGDDPYNTTVDCDISDRFAHAADVFSGYDYAVIEFYKQNSDCESATPTDTDVYPASGSCLLASSKGNSSVIVSQYTNGSLDVFFYKGDGCSGKSNFNFTLSSADVAKGSCLKRGYKVYSSISLNKGEGSSASGSGAGISSGSSNASYNTVNITSSSGSTFIIANTGSESSGISGGGIAGIIVAALVVICVVIGFLWYRRRANKNSEGSSTDKPSSAYTQVTSPTTGQKNTDTGITDFSSSVGLLSVRVLFLFSRCGRRKLASKEVSGCIRIS